VDVKKNGSVHDTLTLTAGQVTTTSVISLDLTVFDRVTVKITVVGTASNATVSWTSADGG
jgi:hypothetical protein